MTGADDSAPASQFYTWITTIMLRTSALDDQQMPYAYGDRKREAIFSYSVENEEIKQLFENRDSECPPDML